MRAFYALDFLTNTENHMQIKRYYPKLVNLVMDSISKSIQFQILPMQASMMMSLLEFYRTVEPFDFFREMIRHNLVYVLLMNCDNTRAVDLMVSLIGFADK
jgi:hypothetical protein